MAKRDRNRILCFESRFPAHWNSEAILREKADEAMQNVIFAMESQKGHGVPYDVVVGKTSDGVTLRVVIDPTVPAILAMYPDEVTTPQTQGYAYGE